MLKKVENEWSASTKLSRALSLPHPAPPWAIETLVFLDCIVFFFFNFCCELLLPSVSWIMFSSPSRSLHLQLSQTYWPASVVQSQHGPRMNHVAASMQALSLVINTAIHKSVFSYTKTHGAGKDTQCFSFSLKSNRGHRLCVILAEFIMCVENNCSSSSLTLKLMQFW